MPELPDLENFARNLDRRLAGRAVQSLTVHRPKRVREPDVGMAKAVVGRKFAKVRREGKEVWFQLDEGRIFSVHLMLSGGFFHCPLSEAPELRAIALGLDDENVFGYYDPRGLAILEFDPQRPSSPDALSTRFDSAYLESISQRKPKALIKSILIDPSIVRGIGNAYADEILYAARVHPASAIGAMPLEVLAAVARMTHEVLREAIDQIASAHPDILAGEERAHLKVHVKDLTHTNSGGVIRVEEIAGKQSYFSDEQALYRD